MILAKHLKTKPRTVSILQIKANVQIHKDSKII